MKNLPLFLFVLSVFTINAQNYDFGKVSKEELEEKFNPLDSTASATYLYKKRHTFFEYRQGEGFELITEIHERIKVYNQKGFDYATKSVSLYKRGGVKESVGNLKAYTYNLVDGKIEESKLKKDGIFETELSRYRDQTKFTMPHIKEGCVVEYKYRITSPFYSNVDEFLFQHAIPVKKIEAKFEAPEYYNFKIRTKGYLRIKPKNETKNDKITFTNKSRAIGTVTNGGGSTTTFSQSDLRFVKNISSYDLENIPALKEEPYVNNIDNYRSSVKYELSYIKFPESQVEYFSTTWEDVIKTIYKSSSFGDQLNKTSYFEEDIDALISSVSDPTQKAALIYNFVKSKVKWNGYYNKYVNDGVRKAYKEQTGNVAEINLMLTAMLRYANLDANPVLVSSRGNGIPLFPTREGYDYVVSSVTTPQGTILLDATSKYSLPNLLPMRALNWEGKIIRKDGTFSSVNLYPKEVSTKTVSMMVNLTENGDVEGNMRLAKTGHSAMSYRENYIGKDKDQYIERLENKYGGIEISDFSVKNELDLSKPVMESCKFFLESQADIIGDKMYVSPMFFLQTKENIFKLEDREFPVDFGYPIKNIFRININFPEGYEVESNPEPLALALPDNLGSFKYKIVTSATSAQLIITTEVSEPIISALYYSTLKEYYKQLIEKENEKIVLKKV